MVTRMPKDTQAPDPITGTNIQTPQTHSLRHSTAHAINWPMPQPTTYLMVVCVCTWRRHSPRDNIQKRLPRGQCIKTCPHTDISTSSTARPRDSHVPTHLSPWLQGAPQETVLRQQAGAAEPAVPPDFPGLAWLWGGYTWPERTPRQGCRPPCGPLASRPMPTPSCLPPAIASHLQPLAQAASSAHKAAVFSVLLGLSQASARLPPLPPSTYQPGLL